MTGRRPRWIAWLQLIRLPNLCTVLADSMMGFTVAGGWMMPRNAWPLVYVLIAGATLYSAGMVLNDLVDVDRDRRQRPDRPLPAGEISIAAAWALTVVLLVVGVISATLAGWTSPAETLWWRSGLIALLLAASIIGYDRFLKTGPLGPVAMGACRSLNLLLAMAAAGANGNWFAFHPFHWTIVLGMGMYVAGITLWARREAETILRRELLLAVWVMIAGIGLFVALEKVSRPPEVVWAINGPWIWPALLLLLSAPLVRRLARAIRSCLPGDVQAAVGQAIGNLIFYDAALCLAVGEPSVAIGVLVLVLPMRLLGRWLYST